MLRKILTGEYHSRFINTCIFPEMIIRIFIFTGIVLTSCLTTEKGFSQQYHTTSARALKAYKTGLTSFDYIDYPNAESYFREAIEIDDKFYEAYMMLGELLSKQKRYPEAALNYKKAVSMDSTAYMPVFFNMATAEMMSGDYENALIHYNVYIVQKKISAKNRILQKKI